MPTLKESLTSFFSGLVEATGTPSAPPAFVDTPDGRSRVALVRSGYSVTVQPGPMRLKRDHTFADLASMAEWLRRHADAGRTEILVNDTITVAALSPTDVDGDQVTTRMILSPEATAWRDQFGVARSQRALFDFVRSHLTDFTPAMDADGNTSRTWGAILFAELRKVQATTGKDFTVEIDQYGMTRFAGATLSASVTGSIPPEVEIEIPLFRGVQVLHGEQWVPARYTLQVLVSLSLQEGAPVFRLTAPTWSTVLEEALADAAVWLRHLLGPEWLVGSGVIGLKAFQAPVNA